MLFPETRQSARVVKSTITPVQDTTPLLRISPHESAKTSSLVIIGLVLLSTGLVLNEWTLPVIAHDQNVFPERAGLIAIRIVFGLCVVGGGFLIVFRPWIRRHLGNLVLLFSTLIFLSGTTVGLDCYLGYKAAKFGHQHERIQNTHIPDGRLGWIPKPGAIGYHSLENNFDVEYRMDEQGFKQTPLRSKPEITVYFFGDSYTFGHGVANKDTFTNIMARDYLVPQVQVVNAGVKGYGIVQMYGRFLQITDRLSENDLVVFTPTTQDIERNWEDFRSPAQFIFSNREPRVEYYPYYYEDGRLGVARIDTTLNRVRALFLLAPFSGDLFAVLHRAIVTPSDKEQARQIFNMVKSLCETQGAKFALIFLPTVKELLEESYTVDVSSFDSYDIREFFQSDRKALMALRFPENSHWNRQGHEIAARAISATLVREKLIAKTFIQDPHLLSPP